MLSGRFAKARLVFLALPAVAALAISGCGGGSAAEANDVGAAASNSLLATGRSPVSTSPSVDQEVLESSVALGQSRLYVKLDGADQPRIPIRNGGTARIGDGVFAEIFVDPYPTNSLTAWLDLYLADAAGSPISDAHTQILYDMWSMGHGPYTGLTEGAADGHYVFRLDYIMFGAWEQVLEVRLPDSDDALRLTVIIVAMP